MFFGPFIFPLVAMQEKIPSLRHSLLFDMLGMEGNVAVPPESVMHCLVKWMIPFFWSKSTWWSSFWFLIFSVAKTQARMELISVCTYAVHSSGLQLFSCPKCVGYLCCGSVICNLFCVNYFLAVLVWKVWFLITVCNLWSNVVILVASFAYFGMIIWRTYEY